MVNFGDQNVVTVICLSQALFKAFPACFQYSSANRVCQHCFPLRFTLNLDSLVEHILLRSELRRILA